MFFNTDELAKTVFVAENSSTENTKRILIDKYFQAPSSYEIEKMNEKSLENAINQVSKAFNNAVTNVKNYIENTKEYQLKERVEEIFKSNLEEKNSIEKVKEDLIDIYKYSKHYYFADIPSQVVKLNRELEEKQEEDREKRFQAYMEKLEKKKNDDYEYTYSSSSTSTTTTATTTVEKEEKDALQEAIKNQRLAEEERLRDLANAESNSNKKKVKSVIVKDKGNKGKDREIE